MTTDTPRALFAGLLLLASLATVRPTLAAQDAPDLLKKQREAVTANLKAGKLTFNTVETPELLVSGPYPAAQLARVAGEVQKAYAAAILALKFTAKDDPIPGKLAVYIVTEPKQHKIFLLQAFKRAPRVHEAVDLQLRGEAPYVVLNAGADEKPSEASVTAQASRAVAAALLNIKAGTTTADVGLPTWLETGFGNAVTLRAEGNATKLAAHKARVRGLVVKTRGLALQLPTVWGENPSPESDTVVTSFVEYLVYGPGADKFSAILAALKPSEGNDSPTIGTAFTAVDWKPEAIEAAWRKWATTGK